MINYYQTIPALGIRGRMDTPKEFDAIGLPKEMQDLDVLDIGCNAGAFLIESYKRGAKNVIGIESNYDWRLIAQGMWHEACDRMIFKDTRAFECFASVSDLLDYKLFPHRFDLVLCLSVTHVAQGQTGQQVLNSAWAMAKKGGMLILEINDRLQKEKLKLPKGAKFYGKNKDNRSVWHIVKREQH